MYLLIILGYYISRLTAVKINKLNIIYLIMANDTIITIYIRELTGYFYLKQDSVLKYLIRLYII